MQFPAATLLHLGLEQPKGSELLRPFSSSRSSVVASSGPRVALCPISPPRNRGIVKVGEDLHDPQPTPPCPLIMSSVSHLCSY